VNELTGDSIRRGGGWVQDQSPGPPPPWPFAAGPLAVTVTWGRKRTGHHDRGASWQPPGGLHGDNRSGLLVAVVPPGHPDPQAELAQLPADRA